MFFFCESKKKKLGRNFLIILFFFFKLMLIASYVIQSHDVLLKLSDCMKQKQGDKKEQSCEIISMICGRDNRLSIRSHFLSGTVDVLAELSEPYISVTSPLDKKHKSDYTLHFMTEVLDSAIKSHFGAYRAKKCQMSLDVYDSKVVFVATMATGETASISISACDNEEDKIITAADALQHVGNDGLPESCIGNNYNHHFDYDISMESAQLGIGLISVKKTSSIKNTANLSLSIKPHASKTRGILSASLKDHMTDESRDLRISEAGGVVIKHIKEDDNYVVHIKKNVVDQLRKIVKTMGSLLPSTHSDDKKPKKRKLGKIELENDSDDDEEVTEDDQSSTVLLRLSKINEDSGLYDRPISVMFSHTGINVRTIVSVIGNEVSD